MKLLLTSSGISNLSIQNALIDLLGKPIAESNALFVPTAIYPFRYGARFAWNPISGKTNYPLCGLGWKSVGLLELSALPSINEEVWLPALEEADALLFWGGDPLYLSYWLQESGLKKMLPSLLSRMVYVGVSAGSMAASTIFGETYSESRGGRGEALTSEKISFSTPTGEVTRTLVTAQGAGLVDFAIIPHFENTNHPDASMENAKKWAAMVPTPVYAIDEQTAIKVSGNNTEVVSEGRWKYFPSHLA
jgi:dipeptidase E